MAGECGVTWRCSRDPVALVLPTSQQSHSTTNTPYNSAKMEEDEDDFYGEAGGVKQEQAWDGDDKEEKMDVSDDEEEEDSDDVWKPGKARTSESVDTDCNVNRMSNSHSRSPKAQNQNHRRSSFQLHCSQVHL